MSNVAKNIGAPRVPQVNLLPPEVAARRNASNVKAIIALVTVLVLIGFGAGIYLSNEDKAKAEERLEALQDERHELSNTLATYNYLPALQREVNNALMARYWVGAHDVLWADVVHAMTQVLPPEVVFESIDVRGSSPLAVLPPSTNPFSEPLVGELSFRANSDVPVSAADLADALEVLPGLHNIRLTVVELVHAISADYTYWQIDGLIEISHVALSGRVNPFHTIVIAPPEDPVEPEEPATNEGDQ